MSTSTSTATRAPEKLLPQNVEAEAALLGSVLIDPDALSQTLDIVTPDDFYREAHRLIFASMAELFGQGTPADLITLTDEMARCGTLEDAGGISYVASLPNHVPTSRNARHYAEIVLRTSVLRGVIQTAGKMAGMAYNDPDEKAALDQSMQLIGALYSRSQQVHNPLHDVAFSVRKLHEDVLRRMDDDEVPGVRTGFHELDKLLLCFEPTNLVYISGRPGDGKTSLALCMAVQMAYECKRRGKGCVDFISLEMSEEEIWRRIAGMRAGINTRLIRAGFRTADGTDDAGYMAFSAALAAAEEELQGWFYTRGGPMSTAQVRAHAQAGVAERDLRVVFVDQLSKLTDKTRSGEKRDAFDMRSGELKQIARQTGIVLICMAQLNRQAEGTRPSKEMLKESGALEEDADVVLALHRPAVYDAARALSELLFRQYAEAHIIKGRDVPVAMVKLRYEAEYTRYTDWPPNFAEPDLGK